MMPVIFHTHTHKDHGDYAGDENDDDDDDYAVVSLVRCFFL